MSKMLYWARDALKGLLPQGCTFHIHVTGLMEMDGEVMETYQLCIWSPDQQDGFTVAHHDVKQMVSKAAIEAVNRWTPIDPDLLILGCRVTEAIWNCDGKNVPPLKEIDS